MDKLEKLFQDLMRAVPGYPLTLIRLLVAPRRVFSPKAAPLTTSPGVTVVFSVFLAYFAYRYMSGALSGGPSMFEAPPRGWLVFTFVYIALLIGAQRLALSLLLRRAASTPGQLAADFGALSYAYALILPFGAILPVLRRSPEWGWPAVAVLVLVYGLAMFNVVRHGFHLTGWRAVAGVLLCLLTIPIVGGIAFVVLIMPFR